MTTSFDLPKEEEIIMSEDEEKRLDILEWKVGPMQTTLTDLRDSSLQFLGTERAFVPTTR